MENNNQYDYIKAEHDAAVADYEKKKKEIEERHKETMKSLQKQMIIRYVFLALAAGFFIYVCSVLWFRMLAVSGLILFIAIICIVDIYKRRSAEKTRLRSQISRMVYNIELKNVYIEDVYRQELHEKVEKSDKRQKNIKTIVIIAVVIIVAYIIGRSWLYSFNAHDWQKLSWKRKYMISNLSMQQDSFDKNNHIHKYNFKFMTEEEIVKLLAVPDASEYTDTPVIEGIIDTKGKSAEGNIHYYIFFAFYDKKEKQNVYSYALKYDREDTWQVGLTSGPENLISAYSEVYSTIQ